MFSLVFIFCFIILTSTWVQTYDYTEIGCYVFTVIPVSIVFLPVSNGYLVSIILTPLYLPTHTHTHTQAKARIWLAGISAWSTLTTIFFSLIVDSMHINTLNTFHKWSNDGKSALGCLRLHTWLLPTAPCCWIR